MSEERADYLTARKEEKMQTPSVGRIVHYVGKKGDLTLPQGTHCAAIVTAISEERSVVFLNVFHPIIGTENVFDVVEDTSGKEGIWHWPERSEG